MFFCPVKRVSPKVYQKSVVCNLLNSPRFLFFTDYIQCQSSNPLWTSLASCWYFDIWILLVLASCFEHFENYNQLLLKSHWNATLIGLRNSSWIKKVTSATLKPLALLSSDFLMSCGRMALFSELSHMLMFNELRCLSLKNWKIKKPVSYDW